MHKHRFQIIWLLLLALLLAACGGNVTLPVEEKMSEPVQDTAVDNTPTESPTAPTAIPTAVTESKAAEVEIMPITAKPQLVEFYADW